MILFSDRSRFRSAFLIFFLTAAVYLPVFNAGFIWDDDAFLTLNPLILSPDGLFRIWFTTEAPDYFPLVSTSLWLEWRLWGLNAAGYHIANVALHAISSSLLFLIFKELGIKWALFAAIIFAVHPVNVESVAWITERKNTLAMPLYLASILFFVRFQKSGTFSLYLFSLLMFTLSLLSKTSVVMLPFVLLGVVLWQKGSMKPGDIRITMPFFFLSLVMGLITVWFQYNRAIGDEIIRNDGFILRLVTAGTAVWFYLYKALLPLNLIFVYPRWDFTDSSPFIFLPLAALLFLSLIFWKKRRSWARPLLFGFGYFLVTLFPVLGFLNIYFMKFSFVSDHWQYFAIAGPVALLAYFWGALYERAAYRGRSFLTVTAALIILLSGSLSFNRARVYKSDLALYNDVIQKNKNCWMAYNNRGHVHDKNGDTKKALRDFDRAIEIKPDYAEAYFNRGVLRGRSGEVEEAIDDYTQAVRWRPEYADAYYNRGVLYVQKGRKRPALDDFNSTIRINPGFFSAYLHRGALVAESGMHVMALDDFNRAIEIEPGSSEAYVNRGVAYAMSGNYRHSIADFTQAINLDDGEVLAYVNRSRAYREVGSYALSLKDIKAAVKLGAGPLTEELSGLSGKSGLSFAPYPKEKQEKSSVDK